MASFPQLKDAEITVHRLRSDYIYLEARFTFASYFFERRLRYMVLFNPDALRAVFRTTDFAQSWLTNLHISTIFRIRAA